MNAFINKHIGQLFGLALIALIGLTGLLIAVLVERFDPPKAGISSAHAQSQTLPGMEAVAQTPNGECILYRDTTEYMNRFLVLHCTTGNGSVSKR